MSHIGVILLITLLGLGYFAVKERAFWNMRRSIAPIPSPLSQALAQLVGTAGGIYLALGLLTAFVGLELPERIRAYGLGLDPLALISIALAIIQPYYMRLSNFWRKWRA